MKTLSMTMITARGSFVVTDIKAVCYANVGTPTIHFKNRDGEEYSVPFEEIVSFLLTDGDVDDPQKHDR